MAQQGPRGPRPDARSAVAWPSCKRALLAVRRARPRGAAAGDGRRGPRSRCPVASLPGAAQVSPAGPRARARGILAHRRAAASGIVACAEISMLGRADGRRRRLDFAQLRRAWGPPRVAGEPERVVATMPPWRRGRKRRGRRGALIFMILQYFTCARPRAISIVAPNPGDAEARCSTTSPMRQLTLHVASMHEPSQTRPTRSDASGSSGEDRSGALKERTCTAEDGLARRANPTSPVLVEVVARASGATVTPDTKTAPLGTLAPRLLAPSGEPERRHRK